MAKKQLTPAERAALMKRHKELVKKKAALRKERKKITDKL